MFRKMAIAAGITAASLIAFVPAASAQSITLSIGSGSGYGYNGYGYNAYGYGNAYPGYAYGYSQPQNYGYYPSYGYSGYNGYNAYSAYNGSQYGLAQRLYAEQLQRWQRERAREQYQGRDPWNDDNDDNDDNDGD